MLRDKRNSLFYIVNLGLCWVFGNFYILLRKEINKFLFYENGVLCVCIFKTVWE